MSELIKLVEFWFENKKHWFRPNEKFDNDCRKFLPLFDNKYIILKNNLEILGQIILYDQISRNIFRGSPEAYKYDNLCINLCLDNLSVCSELSGWYKIFFLMPLKHSEDLEIHKQNLQIWKNICDFEIDNFENLYTRNYNNIVEHYKIIKMFGRYPLRNKILDRDSSESEKLYIKDRKGKFF